MDKTFLDIILAAKDKEGNGLTDEAIQNEVDVMMFAGKIHFTFEKYTFFTN